MISKLCTHAPTRAAATDAMVDALDGFALDGIRHNIPFLSALMVHPRWREGRLSTGFIPEEFPDGFQGAPVGDAERTVFAAIVATAELTVLDRLRRRPGALPGVRRGKRPEL